MLCLPLGCGTKRRGMHAMASLGCRGATRTIASNMSPHLPKANRPKSQLTTVHIKPIQHCSVAQLTSFSSPAAAA
jgi:hypothetical protein